MKKLFIIMVIIGMGMTSVFSQETNETTVLLNKDTANAFTVKVEQADATTTVEALKSYFASQNFVKPQKEGNFIAYKAQKLPHIGPSTYDLFFSASQTGKKDNIVTTLYFVCSLGNNNYVNSRDNENLVPKINDFLSKTPQIIERYKMEQEIKENEKNAEKLNKEREKHQKNLEKAQKAMDESNSKINKLNNSIQESKDKLSKFVIFE